MPSLEEQLAEISKQYVEDKVKFTVLELFTNEFMQENSKFSSIEEFQQEGNFVMNTEEDIRKIDQAQLDSFIQQNTKFASWNDMCKSAEAIQVGKKLTELGIPWQ